MVERVKVGHGSLYRETDTVLKKLLINAIKFYVCLQEI